MINSFYDSIWASQVVLVVKNTPANVRDPGLIPGLGRFPGGGNGNPLQYSCLENPHGQRSLMGHSPWGFKESDTAERLHFTYKYSSSGQRDLGKVLSSCAVLCLFSQLCPTLRPIRLLCPWGFSRQEYWSGLPCPPPGDLPNAGVKPRSPVLQADS